MRILSFPTPALFPALALLAGGAALAGGEPLRGPSDAGASSVEWMERSSRVVDALGALERGRATLAAEHAEAALEQALSRNDRLAALNVLCVGHVAADRADVALPYCDRVVAETHGDWRALNNRANARLAVGELRAAVHDYERALAALEATDAAAGVRTYGGTGWQSGRDMVAGNLALARERLAADWQVARIPDPPG